MIDAINFQNFNLPRMNEVKKFVEDVREEERRKQEEREMEERRAVASLKIQVRISYLLHRITENFLRIIKLQIIILILVMLALRGQRLGQSKLVQFYDFL